MNPVNGFICGGVVIDATHIATAAHCMLRHDDGPGDASEASTCWPARRTSTATG